VLEDFAFKCGEQWDKERACPAQVQTHVTEELLAMFSCEEVIGEPEEMFTTSTSPLNLRYHFKPSQVQLLLR
jgi:hypothetical protein